MSPQPTDVISYVYLWSHEAAAGRDEGSKERPVVVVLATREQAHGLEVIVAPITTQPPGPATHAVEIPARVRDHLGLDPDQSWIVCDELNSFTWPGPDIRPIRAAGDRSPFYGKIPGRLYEQVRGKLAEVAQAGRLDVTKRTE
jgi:mRNA-degrading endonuclease toxin of MazEF toxin-antitoxin module